MTVRARNGGFQGVFTFNNLLYARTFPTEREAAAWVFEELRKRRITEHPRILEEEAV
jgi:hypothetical protein